MCVGCVCVFLVRICCNQTIRIIGIIFKSYSNSPAVADEHLHHVVHAGGRAVLLCGVCWDCLLLGVVCCCVLFSSWRQERGRVVVSGVAYERLAVTRARINPVKPPGSRSLRSTQIRSDQPHRHVDLVRVARDAVAPLDRAGD